MSQIIVDLDDSIIDFLKTHDEIPDIYNKSFWEAIHKGIDNIDNKYLPMFMVNDIIIRLRNDRGKDIAKIVFRGNRSSEEEFSNCWISDVDGTDKDNEAVYRVDLSVDPDTVENLSNDTLLTELKSRLIE